MEFLFERGREGLSPCWAMETAGKRVRWMGLFLMKSSERVRGNFAKGEEVEKEDRVVAKG